MWRREKVWYGVPRCPTVFLGVPVFLRCSSVLLVDLRCLWEFLGVHRFPTVFLAVSSFSYVAPTVFHGVSRCPTGFLGLIGVPLCSSVFLCVTRFPTVFFYIVLHCYTVFLLVPRCSSFFRRSFGFLVFYSVLRVSFLPYGVLRDSSLFFGVFLCSGFFRVRGSSWFLSVPCYYKVFFGIPRCSGFSTCC